MSLLRGRAGAAAAALLLAAGCVGLAAAPFALRLEAGLGRATAPSPARSWTRMQTLLRRLGRLELQPPAVLPGDGAAPPGGVAARCADPSLGVARWPAADLPSSRLAPAAEVARGIPLLSLYLEPCRRGRIESNPAGFGRDWEEPGWVSFFEAGELRFATAAGVRLHGGADRRRERKSYRIHFRPRFGAEGWPGELLAPGLARPISPLVVDASRELDQRHRPLHFVDGIAYDVARRVGAPAPRTRPVALSVNGEAPQPYLLVERPDEEYLERTYGHRDFERLRAKRGTDSAEARGKTELLRMVRGGPDAGFAERAERRFDTTALLDVVTAALWCATGESFQSVLVRDRRGELAAGRWFWVVWDFDMSFVGRPRYSRFGTARDYLPHVLRPPRHALVNQLLLQRLLESDPAFRLALAERMTRALNHELTSAWFDGLIDGYERDARRLGVADLRYLERLRAFGRGRGEAVYAQLASHLGVGAPQPVEIVAPPGSVRVDGLSLAGGYRGRYPAGVSIRLDVEPAASARFAGWRADGRLLEGRPLRLALPVRGPLRIEARFDG